MARTTQKDVQIEFENLASVMGRDTEPYRRGEDGRAIAQVGAWHLDHNTHYGGYVVHEIANSGGGVTEPFGSRRLSAREAVEAFRLAARAVDNFKRNR